ncbi:MAG: OmpA family protein [Prevotella sp.]|nr:OmpA family protein [Prevotella sp.]
MIRKAFMTLAVLLFLIPETLIAQGQSERFDANFTIAQKTFGKNSEQKYTKVRYHLCNTYKMAQDYRDRLLNAIKRDDEPGTLGNALETEIARMNFQFAYSRNNGTISTHVEQGMGLLVLGDDGAVAIEIETGKTDYQTLIEGHAALEISEVSVYAKKKQPKFKKVPSVDTGYEIRFNINAHLAAGYTNENSRLMIQPMITDCQTDDTVAYMKPMVYEGRKYHSLQNRRMSFNYHRNDPVAYGYHPEIALKKDEAFELDTNVVFRKPDKDKSYKCAYFVTVEDYEHIMYDNGGEGTGSCLSFKPFKFLDFNVGAAELPLTSEFYDQAESRVRDVPRNLQLRFQVGTDELTKDSINEVELRNLTKEMSSYGDRLTQIRIEGAASPEGSMQTNRMLAQKRAIRAQQMLKNRLGAKADNVRLPSPTVTVHTWADVAAALENCGDTSKLWKVREIRNIISQYGETDAYNKIKNLLYYDSDIEPVLESQRVMKCSYQYEVDHVMNNAEVMSEYFDHKDDYIKGTRDLSDGDYYNLFSSITDSTQLDILTDVAYRHTVRQPAYEVLRLSPYVANRKALKNMRNGIYDTSVLRPFVDFSLQLINSEDKGTGMIRNRKEILINQAINYFQESKLDTAQYIVDWLKGKGEDARIYNLSMLITFVHGFFQTDRTEEEEATFKKASDFVFNSNDINKAVLYSELHSQLPKTRQEAEEWVNKMDDKDARKWYLEGILWSGEASKESGSEEVPNHLAYFQHSFDLQPRFKRYYFNEGNVSDDIRKIHPYRRKDIEKYRKAFLSLMEERNEASTNKQQVPAETQTITDKNEK